MRLLLPLLLACLAAPVALPACTPDANVTGPCLPCGCVPRGFDPHVQRHFDDEPTLAAFCETPEGELACKFVMPVFQPALEDPRSVRYARERGGVEWMSPRFYTLHDQYWWYHLLNGAPIDGCRQLPLQSGHFDDIASIEAALEGRTRDELPFGLEWSGSRLYSPNFYARILGACEDEKGEVVSGWNECPRKMGGGTLAYHAADPERPVPEAFWAFKLYLDDRVQRWELERFFTRLEASLPPQVAANLRWVARAQNHQEQMVEAIRAEGGPLAAKVLTSTDVFSPGEMAAYNEGVAVGRVRRVATGGLGQTALHPDDITVLQTVPDELPPVAAILTAEPQTPQAHINLLARARGTPNAFVAGVFDDAQIREWGDGRWMGGRRWLAVRVRKSGVDFHAMEEAELKTWREMTAGEPVKVPLADLAGAPMTTAVDEGDLAAMQGAVPLNGGKCAGMMGLYDAPGLDKPWAPLCITVAGYDRHIEGIKPLLNATLGSESFAQSPRLRYLLLEGRSRFEDAHANDGAALAWLAVFMKKKAPSLPAPLQKVLAGGGIVGLIRDRPIDPKWLAALRGTLLERFGALAETQGLRFRSSATVEDIEGFNGAGVYASYTGYLHPKAQANPAERKKTVERAIKRTWSSYWRYAAFEERRVSHIDHTTGRMAVLVHPRFDDPLEASNGVALVSIARRLDGQTRLSTEVNVQAGDLSVTNPPPGSGAAPEVDRVVQEPQASPVVVRVQGSTEVPAGAHLLSDAELLWMHGELVALAKKWLAVGNADLAPPERRLTLVLDLELRKMKPGWPALKQGPPLPGRIVFKQARTLMSTRGVSPGDLGGAKAPLDLVAAAVDARRRTCKTARFELETVELRTAAGVSVYEHHLVPFVARVRLGFPEGLPALGIPAGTLDEADHTQWASVGHDGTTAKAWAMQLDVGQALAAKWGWRRLSVAESGAWRLEGAGGGAEVSGEDAACETTALKLSPTAWLEGLFGG